MAPIVNYFIHVKDHINKTTRIINKITNLDTCSHDFNTIVKYLNKDNIFTINTSNCEAELFKSDTQVVPGYIYNSTKTINTLVYTLSLIKIDSQLSNIFQVTCTTTETQTIEQDDTKNIQTQEDWQKQYKETNFSQTTEKHSAEECDTEFGAFQSYTPSKFTNTTTYPYFNDIIIPSPYYTSKPFNSYTSKPFNSYTSNTFNSYMSNTFNSYISKPFNNVMSLRGDNEDVHFTFGSQVPRNPTSSSPIWKPELISELKLRLSQPNAGLTQNNSRYFL
jgi:hypothetical protein